MEAFREGDKYGGSWALLLMYGPTMIVFTYLTSFLFKSPSAAQVFTFLFNFFTGFLLMFVMFILRLIESTRDPARGGFDYLFRFFPAFDFCFGFLSMSNSTLWWTIYKLDSIPDAWESDGMLIEFIYLIILFFVFSVLILVVEYVRDIPSTQTKQIMQQLGQNNEDIDVTNERKMVKEKKGELAISVDGLVKAYMLGGGCGGKNKGFKIAVKDVSFGMNRGDVFGLLGTNGAGKTSTFKVLTGEVKPTSGEVKILGHDVVKEMNKIRHNIGYCPQFDAILDNLTAREHLELFAAIKGIPKEMREKYISKMLEELGLKRYEHVQAGTYSGGNKRKLSVAIALLGYPPILLLDEPSSGMDPKARKFMQKVILQVSQIQKKCSVVLTSHDMAEAELLSTKLSIMVEGNIKCIGPVQQLKSKYGQGQEISIQINNLDKNYVTEMASKVYPPNQDLETATLYPAQLQNVMMNLGAQDLHAEISENGKGKNLFMMMKKNTYLRPKVLFEFIKLQRDQQVIQEFLNKTFGGVTLIESYQSFLKFKTGPDAQLSTLFGQMQDNKDNLNILSYSIKQTTIEQIFVNLARDLVHDDAN